MKFLLMDLEWNAAYSKRGERYINEIIEIGAVILDENLCETASFQQIIRSQLTRRMSWRFRKLTGITDQEMRAGVPFREALCAFTEFSLAADVIVTWSNTDLHVFIDNSKAFLGRETLPFLRNYLDLQPYIQQKLGMAGGNQMSLSACAELLDMDTEGYAFHRAVDDSRACAEMLRRTYDVQLLASQTVKAENAKFYERLLFKAYFIQDINSKEIDRGTLRFSCDICGGPAVRKESWHTRSHGFSAEFRCRKCKREFRAQVRFKKTWDKVIVHRSIHEIEEKELNTEKAEEKNENNSVISNQEP